MKSPSGYPCGGISYVSQFVLRSNHCIRYGNASYISWVIVPNAESAVPRSQSAGVICALWNIVPASGMSAVKFGCVASIAPSGSGDRGSTGSSCRPGTCLGVRAGKIGSSSESMTGLGLSLASSSSSLKWGPGGGGNSDQIQLVYIYI